jgi:Fe-S-cluster containining protein
MPLLPIDGTPDPEGADCLACGRCCHHGPRTVHLLESDDERMGPLLLAEYTVLDHRPPGWRFLKNVGDRCGALDISVENRFPCSIYSHRPDDCRIVEPGSAACLEARRLGHLGTSVEFRR